MLERGRAYHSMIFKTVQTSNVRHTEVMKLRWLISRARVIVKVSQIYSISKAIKVNLEQSMPQSY